MMHRLARAVCVVAVFMLAPAAFAAGEKSGPDTVRGWVTYADGSRRLASMTGAELGVADPAQAPDIPPDIPPDIVVDEARGYQQFAGFGAAITDASAWLIQTRMDPQERSAFLEEMFGSSGGLGLSVTRIAIGASDFSQRHYTYADTPGRAKADIDPARINLIPTLKEMRAINPQLRIVASPWSAPAWMKDSGSLIKGRLRPDRYHDFARYLVSYARAMRKAGVPIDMLTIQNEPHFEPADYPGMRVEPRERAAFIASELGPLMRRRLPGVKLLDWDHNWDEPESPLAVLADPSASTYIDGVAWHCYGGEVAAQSLVHDLHPDKETWFTECSGGGWSGNWERAFGWTVSRLVIGAPRNWARGVVMWNLVLDESSGPHLGGCGNCRGLVTLDKGSGKLTREPEYYAFAHASRFVRPGAVRISSESGKVDEGALEHVAFRQAGSGEIVLIVRNAGEVPRSLRIAQGERTIGAELPAGAVATLTWDGQ